MKKLTYLILTGSLFTSCIAVHHGTINPTVTEKPVQYIDVAYGVAQTNKILGFGGVSKDALVLESKRDLVKNRPLQSNEAYANYTLDFKNAFYLFYWQTKVTLTADVIKYMNDTLQNIYTENYKTKLYPRENNPAKDLFIIGDTVVDKNFRKGVILSFENEKKVRILYKTAHDKIRTKIVSINKIYSIQNKYKGITINDIYYINNSKPTDGSPLSGPIKAFGIKKVLVYIDEKYAVDDYPIN